MVRLINGKDYLSKFKKTEELKEDKTKKLIKALHTDIKKYINETYYSGADIEHPLTYDSDLFAERFKGYYTDETYILGRENTGTYKGLGTIVLNDIFTMYANNEEMQTALKANNWTAELVEYGGRTGYKLDNVYLKLYVIGDDENSYLENKHIGNKAIKVLRDEHDNDLIDLFKSSLNKDIKQVKTTNRFIREFSLNYVNNGGIINPRADYTLDVSSFITGNKLEFKAKLYAVKCTNNIELITDLKKTFKSEMVFNSLGSVEWDSIKSQVTKDIITPLQKQVKEFYNKG